MANLQPRTMISSLAEMAPPNPRLLVLLSPAPTGSSAGGPSCEPTKESPTSLFLLRRPQAVLAALPNLDLQLFSPHLTTTESSSDGPAAASASTRPGRELLRLLLTLTGAAAAAVPRLLLSVTSSDGPAVV